MTSSSRWKLIFVSIMFMSMSFAFGTLLKEDISEHNKRHVRENPYAAPIPSRSKRDVHVLSDSLNDAMESAFKEVLLDDGNGRVPRKVPPITKKPATTKKSVPLTTKSTVTKKVATRSTKKPVTKPNLTSKTTKHVVTEPNPMTTESKAQPTDSRGLVAAGMTPPRGPIPIRRSTKRPPKTNFTPKKQSTEDDDDDNDWEDETASPKIKNRNNNRRGNSKKAPEGGLDTIGTISIVVIFIEVILIIVFNGISLFLFIKMRKIGGPGVKGPLGKSGGKKGDGNKIGLFKSKSISNASQSKSGINLSKSKSVSNAKNPNPKTPSGMTTPFGKANRVGPPSAKKLPPGRKNSAGRAAPSTGINAASSIGRVGAGADPDLTLSDVWATTEGGSFVSAVSGVTDGTTAAFEYAELFGVENYHPFEADTLDDEISETISGFDTVEAIDDEQFSVFSSE